MTTGDEIRTARQRAGLTQQQLATQIGVSQRTIGNWERGETVPQRHAARILDVLGGHIKSAEPSSLEDYSDAALLAEIARRFDLTRSSRETRRAPQDLAGVVGSDGATSRPDTGGHRRWAKGRAAAGFGQDPWALAAMHGISELDRLDADAAARGEEPQEPTR